VDNSPTNPYEAYGESIRSSHSCTAR